MSLEEIICMRTWRFVRDRVLKLSYVRPSIPSFRPAPFDDNTKSYHAEHFGKIRNEAVATAERVLENRIPLFGKDVLFTNGIDWNVDFQTGTRWDPKTDYRFSRDNDPKFVWELNRHQFLPALGKAFFLTGDEAFARKAVSLIGSWIDDNPPFQGINWSSCIESALRQISWLWTFRFLDGSESVTAEVRKKISESMYLQAMHGARNLSFYSSAGNHLISELVSMALVGQSLDRNDLVTTAADLLEEEVDRQILMDGAGTEQSPSYLAHTMEYYVLFALAMGTGTISPRILGGIERGSMFLQSLLNAGEDAIFTGDGDSGQVLVLSSGYSSYRTLLNTAASVTGNGDFLQEDVGEDEKAFWLLGPTRFQRLADIADKPGVRGRRAFEKSGIYILDRTVNGRRVTVVFDCGPLGMKPMAAHGHSDALSFILHVDNHPVFIDPGTYTYLNENRWREYFRGTSAHNTVRIDGVDQSLFGGSFIATRHAEAECTGWAESERVSGRHTGYGFLRSPAVHSRAIAFEVDGNALSIVDRVESSGEHLVEQFFHLGRNCIPEIVERSTVSISFAGEDLVVRFDPRMELSIYYGNEALPLGWLSRTYGSKEKIFTIVGRSRMRGSDAIATRIDF